MRRTDLLITKCNIQQEIKKEIEGTSTSSLVTMESLEGSAKHWKVGELGNL